MKKKIEFVRYESGTHPKTKLPLVAADTWYAAPGGGIAGRKYLEHWAAGQGLAATFRSLIVAGPSE